MRNSIIGVILVAIVLFGCKKDKGCEPVPPENEKTQILKFISDNNLDSAKTYRDIYYQVINPGYGPIANMGSTVDVTYVGKLLNGDVFDERSTVISFPLNSVIEGWQIGIGLIKKGGRIKLIIPSAYAYGCVGNGNIPPNTVLYFDINLVDVR